MRARDWHRHAGWNDLCARWLGWAGLGWAGLESEQNSYHGLLGLE